MIVVGLPFCEAGPGLTSAGSKSGGENDPRSPSTFRQDRPPPPGRFASASTRERGMKTGSPVQGAWPREVPILLHLWNWQ